MAESPVAGLFTLDRDDALEFGLPQVERRRVADVLVSTLVELGVDTAFGICGGGIAHVTDALGQSSMRVVHCRHESGAAFAAAEASLAGCTPTAVFVTTGPGITNTITGLMAARWEGAKVIFISAATPGHLRGRWGFQETAPDTLPEGLYSAGSLFHYAATVDDPKRLSDVRRNLERGLQRKTGFIAHISVPVGLQSQVLADLPQNPGGGLVQSDELVNPRDVDHVVSILRERRCALWVGFGSRHAHEQVRMLAERFQLPVMSSPRGKGVFDENHPLHLGVTGLAGHPRVKEVLAEYRPEHTIVLGSRLGEFTSMWDPAYVPTESFVQVDLDPSVMGVAYNDVNTRGVQAEIRSFLDEVLARTEGDEPRLSPVQAVPAPPPTRILSQRSRGAVRPQALMEAIQRSVVEETESIVICEAGNSFAWGNHALRFSRPCRYRVSMGWGSMGHAVTGVIGASMYHADKAVAIAGDGAMLMNSEVSTAVQYGIPAVWIVLNDSQYGMIEQGMRGLGYDPVETDIPMGTDFVAIARAMGAEGRRVQSEEELDDALSEAMASDRPFVLDVIIDPDEPAPLGGQRATLRSVSSEGAD